MSSNILRGWRKSITLHITCRSDCRRMPLTSLCVFFFSALATVAWGQDDSRIERSDSVLMAGDHQDTRSSSGNSLLERQFSDALDDSTDDGNTEVNIPDDNLRAAVEKALGKESGGTITAEEMATLTELTATALGIADLTGLEFATGLTRLDLDNNQITEVSPLSGLVALEKLHLRNNQITDVSPLTGLSVLAELILSNNQITDISSLLENPGLNGGDLVDLRHNPLDDNSIDVHIAALKERGVQVLDTFSEVDIPDANLRAEVEHSLGKESGFPINKDDMETLTVLFIRRSGISDLTGLEFATGLKRLYIPDNQITDLSPLSGLAALELLYLQNNEIVDLSPLSGLAGLERLTLSYNQITDLSPLSGMTALEMLGLLNNKIVDLSPLLGLTALEILYLQNNEIVDVSPLSSLTQLEFLYLANNEIMDMSPLLVNFGLGEGDFVDLRHNPLDNDSVKIHSATLKKRGVKVKVTGAVVNFPDANLRNLFASRLNNTSGQNKKPDEAITTDEIETVTSLFGPDYNISDLTGLEFATGLEKITLTRGQITDLSPLTGLVLLEELDLSINQIVDLTPLSDLTALETLNLQNNEIVDLSPLSDLTALETLFLQNNEIVDLSPLSGLTRLKVLFLANNAIADISQLLENSGLGEGDYVDLRHNPLNHDSINVHFTDLVERGATVLVTGAVVDIPDANLRAAIERSLGKKSGETITTDEMAAISWLSAARMDIVDLTGLEFAKGLTHLILDNNQVSDLSPLSGLPKLRELDITNNQIVNISPLSDLSSLGRLYLGNNQITDVSPLTGLTYVTEIILSNNRISDISPLLKNSGLGEGDLVDLRHNRLDDDSINVHVVTLENRGVKVLVTGAIVDIPDANLRATIERRLGKESGETITTDEMASLGYLNANAISITDLTGLETATGLTTLYLSNNNIVDISPLSGLTWLGRLNLGNNQITDVSPLTGLTSVTEIILSNNLISDISPLLKNSGLGDGDLVDLRHNPLDDDTINVHVATLENRGVKVMVTGAIVDIPDANLRTTIETYLGKEPGEIITTDEMAELNGIRAKALGIVDLTGLEFATGLPWLSLQDNEIVDVSPLTGLTMLNELMLQGNKITDLSPLSSLTGLKRLYLSNNGITDISPLLLNSGLGEGDLVDLRLNPLDNDSINIHTATLEMRGVSVLVSGPEVNIPDANLRAAVEDALRKKPGETITTDEMASLSNLGVGTLSITNLTGLEFATALQRLNLSNNQITDISPLSGLNMLSRLYLSNNLITDISGLSSLTSLAEIILSYNQISDISPLLKNSGLGEGDLVDLRRNLLNDDSVNVYIAALEERGVKVLVSGPVVDIPDTNLRAWVELRLGKESGETITADEMAQMYLLSGNGLGVTDLTGLEYATGLGWLILSHNKIKDLSPLTGLTALEILRLQNNEIEDLLPLSGLTALDQLYLQNNKIVDLSPLSGLTALEELFLQNNEIVDLSPLSGLTALEYLNLQNNKIVDLSPLSGLTALRELFLQNNGIVDLSPLSDLTALGNLNLQNNKIVDLSPLSDLTALYNLILSNNRITDISPLLNNSGLGENDFVDLRHNPLDDSLNVLITDLKNRGVRVKVSGPAVEIPDVNLRARSREQAR